MRLIYTQQGASVTIPAAPSDLISNLPAGNPVPLTWTDNSNNETGFKVEHSDDGVTSWTLITAVSADVTSYTANESVGKYYRVGAYNAAGTSYSNVYFADPAGIGGGG